MLQYLQHCRHVATRNVVTASLMQRNCWHLPLRHHPAKVVVVFAWEVKTFLDTCRGGIRCLMVTGDYVHTAIAVARGVGMVRPDSHLVIIQSKAELDDKPGSSTYSNLASETSSFKHTSYPALTNFLSPGGSSKPGSRDPSFTGKASSRDPSFTGSPSSRDPSFTSRGSCRGAVSLLQSISARAISQSPLFPMGSSSQWTPSFTGRLARVHPSAPSTNPKLTPLDAHVAATAPSGAAAVCVGVAPPPSTAPLRASNAPTAANAPAGAPASSAATGPTAATSLIGVAALDDTAASSVSAGTASGHDFSSTLHQAQNVEQPSQQGLQSEACEGLVFMLQSADGMQEVSAHHALTSIAQVQITIMHCCLDLY